MTSLNPELVSGAMKHPTGFLPRQPSYMVNEQVQGVDTGEPLLPTRQCIFKNDVLSIYFKAK